MTRPTRIASAVLVGLLLLALFYPALRWLVAEWLGNDYYSHGPLVPLISGFLAWRLWQRWPAPERRPEPAAAGIVLVVIGLGAYLYALSLRAYFAAALAMIAIYAGLTWFLAGPRLLKRMAFPLLFLVFMAPLPIVEPLSVPLAQATGVIAAAVIRLFGVPIVVNGAHVSLPNAELIVGAQCSGLRSIVALLTLVGLLAFVVDGAWWAKILMGVSSIFIAALANILRVASLLGVANAWGAAAGFNYYHNYSGLAFFLSALLLLLLVSRLLGCHEIRQDIF